MHRILAPKPTRRPRRVAHSLAMGAVTLVAIALCALPATAGAGTTSDPASVTGTVIGGSQLKPGIAVALIAIGPSGTRVSHTVSDAKGRFGFTGLMADSAITYTVEATYNKAAFSSDGLTLTPGGAQNVTLNVYPTTFSPAAVSLTSWTVWVDFNADDKMAVQQDVTLRNSGPAAYIGTTPINVATGSSTAAIMLPIAPGAGGFEYLGRFQSCCWASNSNVWAHSRPIVPGNSSGTMRYVAPRTGTLAFAAPYPLDSFSLLVPVGTHVESSRLQRAGIQTDGTNKYQLYRSGPMALGAVLTISLGAPPKSMAPVYWAIAIVLVLLGGLGAWLIWRRRRDRHRTRPSARLAGTLAQSGPTVGIRTTGNVASKDSRTARPNSMSRAARTHSKPHEPAGRSGSNADPSEIADELARLDLAFENGVLDDEHSYRIIREALVQRLVSAVAIDPGALR